LIRAEPSHKIPPAHLAGRGFIIRALRAGAEHQPLRRDFQHLVADPDAVQIIQGPERVDIDHQHRDHPDCGQQLAQPVDETKPAGDTGQRIEQQRGGILAAEYASLLNRDKRTDDGSIWIAMRPCVKHHARQFTRRFGLGYRIFLDRFTRQCALQHGSDGIVGLLSEFIVAPADQRDLGEIEEGAPGDTRRDVSQIRVKKGDGRRKFRDELGPPLREFHQQSLHPMPRRAGLPDALLWVNET